MRAMLTPAAKRKPARRAALLATTIAGLLFAMPYAHADTHEFCDHTSDDCEVVLRGASLDNAVTDRYSVIGENTEAAKRTPQEKAIPFRITVDGQPVAVAGAPPSAAPLPPGTEDIQRTEDLRLEAVDIQVKFDGLTVQPILNVSTKPIERMVAPGQPVEFYGNWNYAAWIARAEVRILDTRGELIDLAPMTADGAALWRAPEDIGTRIDNGEFGETLAYTLRVYDTAGRYDETAPLPLKISRVPDGLYTDRDGRNDGDAESAFVTPVPGYAEDRTAVRNIPIDGGLVTVFGRHIPEGHTVTVFGRPIPIAAERNFVAQQIVVPGVQTIDVAVLNPQDEGLRFSRDVYIPENDWFYVGLADLAVGRNFRHEDRIEALDEDDRNRFYTRGRAAFYVKGKIQGKYLLTGALDTGDDEIEDLFRNLDEKDPRRLLRRLDPDDYYPVYGDDSTTYDDAPTRGKFYVRLERDDSHVMWGNFKTRITGSEFARHERGLYGANVLYRSNETTSFGERRVVVNGFAAEPGTLPQRDEFRGTGGSSYFLRRQDITIGSEQITLDIRDRVTGLSKSRRVLRPEEDYTIDYIQGVIILRRPLGSSSAAGEIVRDGQIGGDPVFLLAQYEYSPATGEFDSYSYGTRTQAWLTDNIRLGGSAYIDDVSGEDQSLVEADATLRLTERSFLEVEGAASEGPGFGNTSSVDGGFRFVDDNGIGREGERSYGLRAKGVLDLQDVTDTSIPGRIGVHYEDREAGFTALDRITTEDTRIMGAFAELEPTDRSTVTIRYDDIDRETSGDEREATAQAELRLTERWSVGAGVTHSDRDLASGSDEDGSRTDIGGRLTYERFGYKLYGFGQVTAQKSGDRKSNHRLGFGAEVDVTDRIAVSGEASFGSLGFGALAAVSYEPTVDQRYYFGYRLDSDRTDGDLDGYDPFGRDTGSIVFGADRRINDRWSVYGEENFDLIGHRQSLTHTYGVTYTPDDRWKTYASFESGQFDDDQGDDFDRTAISAGVDYSQVGMRFGLRGEARLEDSHEGNRQDRETYLVSANAGADYNANWRGIVHFDAVVSNSDESAVLDGDYIEGSIGFAYRPVENDRFNGLARYTFLYDLPGPEQENAAGETLGPKQRSHVVSLDGTYDINEILSVGGKYGFRFGEISESRTDDNFTKSTAHLGVIRFDLHIVKNWDAVLEGRVLHLPEAQSTRYGAFAAVYRHFGENFKLGIGYNFADFSDDLTDLTYDDQGVFINAIGKF